MKRQITLLEKWFAQQKHLLKTLIHFSILLNVSVIFSDASSTALWMEMSACLTKFSFLKNWFEDKLFKV